MPSGDISDGLLEAAYGQASEFQLAELAAAMRLQKLSADRLRR